jgi:outer membrane biosynthesis protein TonB
MPVPQGSAPKPLTNGNADMAAFSPARKLNTMKGSLSNIGKSAVDADATPVGAYKAAVSRAVERRWHELRLKNGSFVSFGSLKIRFEVNSRGNVRGIRVIHQDAGAVLTDFSMAAIATAAIPPMPKDVAEAFGDEPLEVNYDILIY